MKKMPHDVSRRPDILPGEEALHGRLQQKLIDILDRSHRDSGFVIQLEGKVGRHGSGTGLHGMIRSIEAAPGRYSCEFVELSGRWPAPRKPFLHPHLPARRTFQGLGPGLGQGGGVDRQRGRASPLGQAVRCRGGPGLGFRRVYAIPKKSFTGRRALAGTKRRSSSAFCP